MCLEDTLNDFPGYVSSQQQPEDEDSISTLGSRIHLPLMLRISSGGRHRRNRNRNHSRK